MRLCYVAYSPLDLQSANSIQTFNTLRELSKQLGERLTAIVPRFGSEDPPLFPVHRLGRIPVNKVSRFYKSGYWTYMERALYAERARREIAKSRADLIYTRDIVCAYRFVRAGLPILYEVHDLESKHPGQARSARLRAQLEHADEETLRKAHGVVSLTETFRQELVALGWQPASRVFVIPDAYDDTIYFPRDKRGMRAVLNLPQEAQLITYAGMTFKYRGLDVLLHAFRELIGSAAHLVLAGGRELEVDELKTLAQELGIGARVHFVGRHPQDVIAQYLAAADLLVIPDTVTDATASPLKMFEYMAMARPIASVDRASLREIMGDTALYFSQGDVRGFAAGVAAMEPEAQALGERAHELVSEYTYAKRAARIVRAAEAVAAG